MDIEIPNRAISAGNPQTSQNRPTLKLVEETSPKQVAKASVDVSQETRQSREDATQRLEESVSQLNELVQSVQRDLQFSIDEFSGDTVIKVLDTKTAEVIRQIPSEEVLALTQNLESLKGVLFSAEV
ncbi:MAG: flagellar protein FlaG [Gammaproteobacteria bacterium]|nr:flagellar protein FlaG [Gammaproteobacteria bacterium]